MYVYSLIITLAFDQRNIISKKWQKWYWHE